MSELDKLEKYLKEHGYEYTREDLDGIPPYGINHQIIVYKDGDWFCKDAKANPCDTCENAKYTNLEDDDSICMDCGVEE